MKTIVAVDETDDGMNFLRDMGLPLEVGSFHNNSQAELGNEQIVESWALAERFMELLNEERTRKEATPATITQMCELTPVANINSLMK